MQFFAGLPGSTTECLDGVLRVSERLPGNISSFDGVLRASERLPGNNRAP